MIAVQKDPNCRHVGCCPFGYLKKAHCHKMYPLMKEKSTNKATKSKEDFATPPKTPTKKISSPSTSLEKPIENKGGYSSCDVRVHPRLGTKTSCNAAFAEATLEVCANNLPVPQLNTQRGGGCDETRYLQFGGLVSLSVPVWKNICLSQALGCRSIYLSML